MKWWIKKSLLRIILLLKRSTFLIKNMKHELFILFSKLAIVRITNSSFIKWFLKIFNKKNIIKNNELNKLISLATKKIANVKKIANATMTEKEKKFNKVMKIIITLIIKLIVNENIKKIVNEIAKNITTTMKKTFNEKKDAINANVIMLMLNAIIAMKWIMNDVVAKNYANNEKMIKI